MGFSLVMTLSLEQTYYRLPENMLAELTKRQAFPLWLLFSTCFCEEKIYTRICKKKKKKFFKAQLVQNCQRSLGWAYKHNSNVIMYYKIVFPLKKKPVRSPKNCKALVGIYLCSNFNGNQKETRLRLNASGKRHLHFPFFFFSFYNIALCLYSGNLQDLCDTE